MERERIHIKPIQTHHHHKLTSTMSEGHVHEYKFKKPEVEYEE